jgi:quercetin dioxygenase-like cupin family protein
MIMNTASNPPNDTTWRMSKSVLNAGELNGSLTLIGPDCELPASESPLERVIYVARGTVTASFSAANYILNVDETLVVPPSRALGIRNSGETPAKVLIISLPAPRRLVPALVTLN